MSGIGNCLSNIPNVSEPSLADHDSKRKIKKDWSKAPFQKYIGEVLRGNLHGQGFYFVEEGKKLFYDGLFYTNKLEGYAQVFYNDGSDFQGLFKNNVRFGPGVLTYPNGEQDVGLWSSHNLLRLSSLDQKNPVPKLAATPTGRMKILKYRYLVQVCPRQVDVAYEIMQRMGASQSLLKRSHELYNAEVGNNHNIFFNRKLFDDQFYGDQDCYIDVILSENEEKSRGVDPSVKEPADRDIDAERVRQINEVLGLVDSKLRAAQEKRLVIQKKVDYCRACCSWQQRALEESLTPPVEEASEYDVYERKDVRAVTSTVSAKISAPRSLEKVASVPDSDSTENLVIEALFEDERSLAVSTSVDSVTLDQPDTSQKDTDVTSQIKNYLMNTCGCDEMTHGGDLCEMEQELEALTKDDLFFQSISNNLKEKLEKHLKQSRDARKVKTKKVLINDVIAWNNEKYCVRMLKHSFLHRKSEYMVNFKVSDLIAGKRSQFKNPGVKERNCADFLAACSAGNIQAIYGHVKKSEINVNVCDANGNSGLIFAALNNHKDVIRTLVNLGAKLDHENDEGLLPLSMCLLTYLAEKYKVDNWEKSFLTEVECVTRRKEAFKWYPNTVLSKLSTERLNAVERKSKDARTDENKHYFFDTSFIDPEAEKLVSPNKDDPIKKKMSIVPTPVKGIRLIESSIKTLLQYGANPNAGDSPLPSLFLSIFTEEPSLVESILDARADVDIAIEGDLTCLHVIASSRCIKANVSICHLLVSRNCDPRLRASPNHWKQQKTEILGKDTDPNTVEDYGKNPLHILCIRRDFLTDNCSYFRDMVMIFRDSYIDFNARYLGHTPLSLAVLVGNKNLVETLMDLDIIDPYQVLDYNMGNVLTIYILKRYEDLIPSNAKTMLDTLTQLGVNVFTPIRQFENVVAFMENELEVFGKRRRSSVIRREMQRKIMLREKQNEIPKEAQKKREKSRRGTLQEELMDYIKELGRNTIIKCIQLLSVENLYNLVEDDYTGHNCVSVLAQFLTPDVLISNLQLLFRHGRIAPERFNKDVCLQLIRIVCATVDEAKKRESTSKKGGGRKMSTVSNKQNVRNSFSSLDYSFLLQTTDFTRVKVEKPNFKLPPPGLDKVAKYKVCFNCLLGKDKELLACPRCQMVHFCSDFCNKENLLMGSPHPCDIDFYSTESERLKSPHAFLEPENLAELYSKVGENCERKWKRKIQANQELAKKRFEAEMKTDTYGTKLLRRNREAGMSTHKTPTMISLVGSVMAVDNMSKMEAYDTVGDSLAKQTNSGSVRWDLSSRDFYKKLSIDKKQKQQAVLTDNSDDQQLGKKEMFRCACEGEIGREKQAKVRCSCPCATKKTMIKLETRGEIQDNVTLKKLQIIPRRCKEFIQLLTEYFPDVDFSSLLLPYACYSNGQLYYKFLDDDHYTRTYTTM